MKLNLGCGEKILDGYINYDKYPINDKVKYLDIEQLPLPFESNSIDEIYISHVIEHLTIDKYAFIKELIRILKPNGKLIVKLPTWNPSINHTEFFHNSNYFECLTAPYKPNNFGNSEYLTQYLDLVYIKKNNRDIKRGIQRIVNLFITMFFGEMEWSFKRQYEPSEKTEYVADLFIDDALKTKDTTKDWIAFHSKHEVEG